MVNQLGKFIPQLAEKDKPHCNPLFKKNCWVWGPGEGSINMISISGIGPCTDKGTGDSGSDLVTLTLCAVLQWHSQHATDFFP